MTDTLLPVDIFTHGLDSLPTFVADLGEKPFRARQLAQWLYASDAESFDEMTNLSKGLREQLSRAATLRRASVVARQVSHDGTRKYVIEFGDGVCVEAVGLPTHDRLTVCLSSQAGCAMGCTFCATGRQGLTRNLVPGEIAEQVRLIGADFERRVSNIVVMGQGEPFANYDNVLAGLRILSHADYFGIGARHITISTSGIIAGIDRLAQEPEQFTLAVSLHSALQPVRDGIMPGLRTQKLDALQKALRKYYTKTGRRPSLEVALIEGPLSNDHALRACADFAAQIGAHINLIPINPVAGSAAVPPAPERMRAIEQLFKRAGNNATVRTERGSDITAACGQLILEEHRKGQ